MRSRWILPAIRTRVARGRAFRGIRTPIRPRTQTPDSWSFGFSVILQKRSTCRNDSNAARQHPDAVFYADCDTRRGEGDFPEEVRAAGASIILATRITSGSGPGFRLSGSTKGFTDSWTGTVRFLTDSGGFQVYSLSAMRRVTDRGVMFRDSQSGTLHTLMP